MYAVCGRDCVGVRVSVSVHVVCERDYLQCAGEIVWSFMVCRV